jgi:hypothetical protein
MTNGYGWVELRRAASRLSKIVVKSLEDSALREGRDPIEQFRLGRVALECLAFRRSLLERRPGPKWSEEEELRKMEQQVVSVMSRLDMKGAKRNESELKRVSRELQHFQQLRRNLGNQSPLHQRG